MEMLRQEHVLMTENDSSTSPKKMLLHQLSIWTQFFLHAPLKHVNIVMWLLWICQELFICIKR